MALTRVSGNLLTSTAVTAGIYGGSGNTVSLTVDAQGRVTAAANVAASGGTPGGSTTQVQYNNAGSFAGSAALTFDGTTLSSNIASAASGVSLNSSTAGKANIVYRSAGIQKAIVGLAGAILGTSSTDLGLFAETGGAIKLFANGASTNSGTFNANGFGIGAAVPSSGQGITFPASQDASTDANTLDDYEEGTFTPTIRGSTTAGTGTYTTQVGAYTKIGNTVFVRISLNWTAHTGTGNMNFGGLPFTSSATTGYDNAVACYAESITVTGQVIAVLSPNNTIGSFYSVNNGTAGNIALDTSGQLIFQFQYQV
jgi:hypothetical protein